VGAAVGQQQPVLGHDAPRPAQHLMLETVRLLGRAKGRTPTLPIPKPFCAQRLPDVAGPLA
jgi:hypothetical protein